MIRSSRRRRARLGVPLCGVLSGGGWWFGWLWVVEGGVSDDGVQCEDTAVGQSEDSLVVAFALGGLVVVVIPADGVGS